MVKSRGNGLAVSHTEITGGDPFPPGNYVGVDPGVNGGIGVIIIRPSVPDRVKVTPMPETKDGILKFLTENVSTKFPNWVFFEKVGGFIASGWGEGKRNMGSGHTMFTFGKATGWVDMALTAAGFRNIIEVIPRTWQKELEIPPREYEKVGRKIIWKETTTEFKNRLKDLAARIFPEVKVTGKIQDALLIAHYGRTMMKREKDLTHENEMGTSRREIRERVRRRPL